VLGDLGVPDQKMLEAFDLLDRRDKMEPAAFTEAAGKLGLDPSCVERFEQACRATHDAGTGLDALKQTVGSDSAFVELEALDEQLYAFGIHDWCEYDLGIVRGLAYYTGSVFEIHETSGAERAIAGGGRYDNLIELFGGPKTPAVGFGMGDVVLSNVLADKGLVPEDVSPRPAAFVLAASDIGAAALGRTVGELRRAGLHVRFSYKTTRNVGKLLKDATTQRARFAIILDDGVEEGQAQMKNLETGDQIVTPLVDIPFRLEME
jgi:histidyl-tRNA synthetase